MMAPRPFLLRRASLAVLAAAAVLLGLGACDDKPPRMLEQGGPLALTATWVDLYPEVREHPQLQRTREVFERMRQTVGVHAGLKVLEMGRGAHALALPDQTILLSRGALDLCYDGVPAETGDVRLAFVLGHELTHVAKDDYWHASALMALQDSRDESKALTRLSKLLAQDGKDRQVLELRADDAGVLALIQAGFDPTPLLEGSRDLFEDWVGGPSGTVAYADPDHPSPSQRADFLRRRLVKVAAQTDLFHRGVEAFRAAEALGARDGDRAVLPQVEEGYEAAASLFDRFRRFFEGREVLNDLALAHLRLASAELARCDGTLVNRFYLPTVLDPVTLAGRAIHRGAGGDYSSPCFENEAYQEHVRVAVRFLEEANERDPGYLPARLNLIAAWVLDEQESSAAQLSLETLEAFPDDPRAAAAWTAASLCYLETGSTLYSPDRVLSQVAELRSRFPAEAGIRFNLASYLTHQGRLEEARPAWREFLKLQPVGPWADLARRWVGEDEATEVADASVP